MSEVIFSPRAKKKKKTRLLILTALFVTVIVFSIFLIKYYDLKRNDVFSSVTYVKRVVEPVEVRDYSLLTNIIEKIIAKYPSTDISVAYSNNDYDGLITAGSDKAMIAASTAKLLVAADFLHQVELGKYSLEQQVGGSSARWQLRQMLQQSNNNSWKTFNNLLTYQQENIYADSIGVPSYDSITNTVKVKELVSFMKKLYNGEILNEEHTSLMLYYLQNTNNETLIPPALPGYKVMHKYGSLNSYLHDVAIAEKDEHLFFLGVYTSGGAERITAIQEIAKAVKAFEEK